MELPFLFVAAGVPPKLPDGPVAVVPRGLKSKQQLLEVLAAELRFPGYFGYNWDALEECLRDLSWWPPSPVLLRHYDLPLREHLAAQRTYLEILRDTAAERNSSRPLVVVFPEWCRDNCQAQLPPGAGC